MSSTWSFGKPNLSVAGQSAASITPETARSAIPAELRRRSTSKGLGYFVISVTAYAVTFVAIAVPQQSTMLRIAFACVNGLTIAVLFVVGHDACHGSLTPRHALNTWLGRLAFLPSLHPYSAWQYSHNAMHHGWTNLRGKDPVYAPLTLEEFRALSPTRQRFERFSRSAIGLFFLYLVTIWWDLEMRPNVHDRRQIDKRGTYRFDRGIVLAFPLVQAMALLVASDIFGSSIPATIAIGVTVPFATFTWLIGFATFQHHTHPRVVWYDDEREWSFARSQVQGTVHVVFPRWIRLMLHNIMEHTAHHIDMRVPLYNLTNAQRSVEEAFGEHNVVTERFTVSGLRRTFQTCQLYDYRAHQWLSYEGIPTTAPPILEFDRNRSRSN